MAVLPTVIQGCITPAESLALDRVLLQRVADERQPWLRVCTWPGDVLVLGRFHPPLAGAGVHRRLSGGRVVPGGAGFVQLSLALPHRSALESDDPHALRPEQALNRAVRGIMGGLEMLGLEPYYPGRDVITVGGKAIGWLSLAVEGGGATLVEAGICLARGLDVLPQLADRLDPHGEIPVTFWRAEETVTLSSALQSGALEVRELGLAIAEGYRRRLQMEPVMTDAPVADGRMPIETRAPERPHARRAVMLGALLASARVDDEGALHDVWLGGDVIAPAATLESLARTLEGRPPVEAELQNLIAGVLAQPDDFLLGATAKDVAAAVVAAAAR